MTAAKVGGIFANNKYPADYINENLQIQTNIINASKNFNVNKLIFIGSSCIYPKNLAAANQRGLSFIGNPRRNRQWYAVAKIAGIKMIQGFRNNISAILYLLCRAICMAQMIIMMKKIVM